MAAMHRRNDVLSLQKVRVQFLVLLFCVPVTLPAQSLDSLRTLADRMPADSNLVLLLNSLAQRLATRDPAEALVHARDAMALAEELEWDRGRAELLNTLGALQTNAGSYEDALTSFQRCLEICRARGDGAGASRALRNIGVVQRRIGNMEEAYTFTAESVREAREAGDSLAYAKALVNLANLQSRRGETRQAVEQYMIARGIFQKEGDRFGESTVLNGLGNCYMDLGRLTEALRMYEQSLSVNEALGNRRAVASVHINLATIHERRKDWREAVSDYMLAMREAEAIGANDLLRTVHRSLAKCQTRLGNFRQATEHYAQFASISDSLFNEEILHQLNARTRQYEMREREQRIALLEAEGALQESRIEREALLRNLSIAGLLALALLAAGIAFLARKRRQQNDELRRTLSELQRAQERLLYAERMATLGRISAGIAHEILNPLNFIINFAQLSLPLSASGGERDNASDEDAALLRENLEKIIDYGRRAERIVASIVQHAEGGTGVAEHTDIHDLLRQAMALTRRAAQAEGHDAAFTLEWQLDPTVKEVLVVPRDLTRVVINIATNAIEAIGRKQDSAGEPFQPMLQISTKKIDDTVEIRIRDNGCGIPTELQERIFEPFFTTKAAGSGTGLGLSIARDIVSKEHGGTLAVESRDGAFTMFRIVLPLR